MLFNSVEFLFLFLPVTLILFHWFNTRPNPSYGGLFLAVASLFFYGWWDPKYLFLILASISINWLMGMQLIKKHNKVFLGFAVGLNLVCLGYYKYANFFVNQLDNLTGFDFTMATIILPLGISFFTFTQIAFLVDAYRGEVKECKPINYLLFVTFFPHLIAGPVLHHKEMMPQFSEMKGKLPSAEMIGFGLFLLITGLFKKVMIADTLVKYVDPAFANVKSMEIIDVWTATLGYSLQLYFDFSAYSEMAMGIALLFGIYLPKNFNSPYKAKDIADFWKRWHMTLSRFLKDYLYIPLGGNRHGFNRMIAALFITMLLGGIWHGAGWQYMIWGAMHGVFLVTHRIWIKVGFKMVDWMAWLMTFSSVMFAWVMFRAQSVSDAILIWKKMLGMDGIVLPYAYQFIKLPVLKFAMSPMIGGLEIIAIVYLLMFCVTRPNVHEILLSKKQPTLQWGIAIVLMGFISFSFLNSPSSFQYFQF
jgi:D-alanyl-lipoteichoic acid acyltransferase DltB (MBOAT superfamily)